MENLIFKNSHSIFKKFTQSEDINFNVNLTELNFKYLYENSFVKSEMELSKEFRKWCTEKKKSNINDEDSGEFKDKPNTDLDENKKQQIMNRKDKKSLKRYNEKSRHEKKKTD